jgi:hypothetical protein
MKSQALKKRNPSAVATAAKQVSSKAVNPASISFDKYQRQNSILETDQHSNGRPKHL